MKRLRKTVLMAATLLLAASFAELKAQPPQDRAGGAPTAQDTPPSPQQSGVQTKIRIPVDQVIVPVTVKDVGGRLLPDLRRDEFRIFEDNIEQRIASFRADAIPISIVGIINTT